jgi:hypothetical protein
VHSRVSNHGKVSGVTEQQASELLTKLNRIIELLEASEVRDLEAIRRNEEMMEQYSAENIARLTRESLEKYREQQNIDQLFGRQS